MTVVASALPVSKRERIVYLLDHWEDIFDPASVSPFGWPGAGLSSPHLSGMSRHPSVVELVRCLAVLRVEAPLLHGHLMAYRCCEWRIQTWVAGRKRKGGKVERVEFRDRVRRLDGWVKVGYVHQAESRLEVLFVGEVFIPGPLWDALTLSSDAIELKERRRRGERVAA